MDALLAPPMTTSQPGVGHIGVGTSDEDEELNDEEILEISQTYLRHLETARSGLPSPRDDACFSEHPGTLNSDYKCLCRQECWDRFNAKTQKAAAEAKAMDQVPSIESRRASFQTHKKRHSRQASVIICPCAVMNGVVDCPCAVAELEARRRSMSTDASSVRNNGLLLHDQAAGYSGKILPTIPGNHAPAQGSRTELSAIAEVSTSPQPVYGDIDADNRHKIDDSPHSKHQIVQIRYGNPDLERYQMDNFNGIIWSGKKVAFAIIVVVLIFAIIAVVTVVLTMGRGKIGVPSPNGM